MRLATRIVNALWRTPLTARFGALMCALSTDVLLRANSWGKKGWEEEELRCSYHSFSSVTIFTGSGCLIKWGDKGKKEYDRVRWLFVFLRMSLPSFCVWNKFWFKWKWHRLSGLSASPINLSWRCNTPYPHLGSCWIFRHHESTEILCLRAPQMPSVNGGTELSLLTCMLLSYQTSSSNLKFKGKNYQESPNGDWRAFSYVPTYLLSVGPCIQVLHHEPVLEL